MTLWVCCGVDVVDASFCGLLVITGILYFWLVVAVGCWLVLLC